MNKKYLLALFLVLIFGVSLVQADDKPAAPFGHVILISVDGLRADAITRLGPEKAPVFHEIMRTGASTLNARTDFYHTETMPGHLCLLTGLPSEGDKGHQYKQNDYDGRSVHEVKGSYVPVIFDVLKENGVSVGFFAAKTKFMLYPKSYEGKIGSAFIVERKDSVVLEAFLKQLGDVPPKFIFYHFNGPDRAGHIDRWDIGLDSSYMKAVREVDSEIGVILQAVRNHPDLAQKTAVIITADHGGTGHSHFNPADARNYTIPFLVWGEGIAAGADLYAINQPARKDPGSDRVPYDAPGQPIRNGDAANLALSLLGLPPIPGSVINAKQDLNVFPQYTTPTYPPP